MVNQAWKKGRILLASMIGVLALTMLTLWGCGGGGGSSYDTPSLSGPAPVATKTATPLVEASEVKAWLDAKLVNKAPGSERVVILEVSDAATPTYSTEHIPGAISVSLGSDLTATRYEGPAEFGSMVAKGSQMDKLIQRCGIDQNTTIVFTASDTDLTNNKLWNLTRGYVTFRYWGFPKERLKVLSGGNKAWKAATYPVTALTPTITPTTYNVTPLNTNRVKASLRASLSEMIAAVRAGSGEFIEGRANSVPTATGTTDLLETGHVVFEGTVAGGNAFAHTNFIDPVTKRFRTDVDTVKTQLTTSGVDLTQNTIYTICRAGNVASVLFFYFDGYLYNDGSKNIVWYDGSWGQWGLMSTVATAKGGVLPAGSAWATDDLTIPAPLTYNQDLGRSVVDITYRLDPTVSHATATANQIEDADKAYLSPINSGGGGTSGGGDVGC